MKAKPSSEYVLLGSLMSGPKHGYEITQMLRNALASIWQVGTSQVYTVLRRLEQSDLVSSSVETQQVRPSKRVYSLTPDGHEVFLDWLHSTTEHVRDLRIEFSAKLFFFKQLELAGGNDLIKKQILWLEQRKEKLLNTRSGETDPYKRMVFSFKTATLETWIACLGNEAIEFIQG